METVRVTWCQIYWIFAAGFHIDLCFADGCLFPLSASCLIYSSDFVGQEFYLTRCFIHGPAQQGLNLGGGL